MGYWPFVATTHRCGMHNRTYLKEEVCFLSKQPVAYVQFIIIREFDYFSQKLLELVMYFFCLLNLQNQDKNSVGYLGKSKPRFSSKRMWLESFFYEQIGEKNINVHWSLDIIWLSTNIDASQTQPELHGEASSSPHYHKSLFSDPAVTLGLKHNSLLSVSYICFYLLTDSKHLRSVKGPLDNSSPLTLGY